jgi:glycosyltransferase involved in cell wall biosynthesis
MERLIADLVRCTDPERFENDVVVLQYLGRFARGLAEFATLHVVRPRPGWSMLWPKGLIRRLREISPDVVHSHSGVWHKASLAARRAGVPRFVHTEHGHSMHESAVSRRIHRLAARRTDSIVVVSKELRSSLAEQLELEPSMLRVILNGVDTTVFRPQPDNGVIRKSLGVTADQPIIGSVGRLEPIKGYEVMLRAYALLRSRWTRGPVPVLVLVGEGSERGRHEALARELGIDGSTFFLGWRDDIGDLHAAFSLFSLASHSEGTSVSLLEAMSAGLCPVVTDVGGNAAVLGPDLAHRIVPVGSSDALAEAWIRALTDGSARRDGDAARRRVESKFCLAAMAEHYEQLYLGVD